MSREWKGETEREMTDLAWQDMKLAAKEEIYGKCQRCYEAPADPAATVAGWFQDHYMELCGLCARTLHWKQATMEDSFSGDR